LKEHYKSLTNYFFIQFSAVYLFFLVVFKFFPEQAKLKDDMQALLKNNRSKNERERERERKRRHQRRKKEKRKRHQKKSKKGSESLE
jgi:hypothetical protein